MRHNTKTPRRILIEKIKNLQRDKNNQEGGYKNKTQPLDQMVLSSSVALYQYQSSHSNKINRLHLKSQPQYPMSQGETDKALVNALL